MSELHVVEYELEIPYSAFEEERGYCDSWKFEEEAALFLKTGKKVEGPETLESASHDFYENIFNILDDFGFTDDLLHWDVVEAVSELVSNSMDAISTIMFRDIHKTGEIQVCIRHNTIDRKVGVSVKDNGGGRLSASTNHKKRVSVYRGGNWTAINDIQERMGFALKMIFPEGWWCEVSLEKEY